MFFWLGVGGGGVLAREIKLLAKQFQCAFILQHTSLDSRKYNMMLGRKKKKRKMRGNSLTANARNSASECFKNVCFLHSVKACSILSSSPLEESPALQRMTKHSGNRALHVAVRA